MSNTIEKRIEAEPIADIDPVIVVLEAASFLGCQSASLGIEIDAATVTQSCYLERLADNIGLKHNSFEKLDGGYLVKIWY